MAPRRIIVACDGTGQSSSRGAASVSTNVSRICHALKHDAETSPQQIVFYQSGVGTGSLGKAYSTVSGGTGIGLDDNVLDAYTFVMNNYLPGDELFLFGFSRGAFTARVLAGLILQLGIFDKTNYSWELKRAFAKYQEGVDKFAEYLKELEGKCVKDIKYQGKPRRQMVTIKVVGCWDTVGSMGIPEYEWAKKAHLTDSFGFYDPRLRPGIENAFHALALDEIRHPFSPTLWYLPAGDEGKKINLQQCWFAGVHTNVGGGYEDQNLANLTLAWMVDKCRPFLTFDESYLNMCIRLDHHPEKINSSLREKNGGFDKKYLGWGLGRLYDSYDGAMALLWWKYRTPGAYAESKEGVGATNESIHASVRERWNSDKLKPEWRPKSLEGFEPVQKNGKWLWVKKGTKDGWFSSGTKEIDVPEEPFTEDKSTFEWRLRYAD